MSYGVNDNMDEGTRGRGHPDERPTTWNAIDHADWWTQQPECGETSRAHIRALIEAFTRHIETLIEPRLLSQNEALRQSLEYVFLTYLPTQECHGPRDCAGTERGCSHCSPDRYLDLARALLAVSSAPQETPP